MARVFRTDAGSLQKPRRTSQGYLRVDGWAARVGIQEYRNPDGSVRRELREDSAVFDDNALTGFEGAPVTDDHPETMVDLHNAKALTKGTVLSVGRRDGDHVAVSMIITDPDLIRKMESGKRQLSTGYYVELDETPGNHPQFGRYDARQVRVGPVNHLAVVERGRAGSAAVRMDSGLVDIALDEQVPQDVIDRLDAIARRLDARSIAARDLQVAKGMPDSVSVMDLTAALARIKELEARIDAFGATPVAEEETDESKCADCGAALVEGEEHTCEAKTDAAEVARLEVALEGARKDAEDAKALVTSKEEAHKAELAKVRADADKLVRDSLDTLSKARAILGNVKIKVDGKDVDLVDAPLRAVKCAVVKHATNKVVDASRTDAYVDVRFEDAIEKFATGANSAAAARLATEAVRTDASTETAAAPSDPEKAAAEANKLRISSAWMATDK